MDDEERVMLGLAPCVGDRRRWGAGSVRPSVVKGLLARTAAGESLRSICRDPQMPSTRTVCQWARERPPFAARLLEARRAAGGPFTGARSTYCAETAQAIFDRVSEGRAVTAVCRDPDMPCVGTVYNWRRDQPEFGRALSEAMALRAEGFFEHGWELAQAATPETAYLTHVRLAHLRWHAGKLAPKKYGAPAQMEDAADAAAGIAGGLTVILKNFVLDGTPGGRESDEPGELLYTMTPEQVAGKIEGKHPATVAWEAGEPQREAYRRAFARAKTASIADGVIPNGMPAAKYWTDEPVEEGG